jgi:hypothetical protein
MKTHEQRRLLKKLLKEAEALNKTLTEVVVEIGHIPRAATRPPRPRRTSTKSSARSARSPSSRTWRSDMTPRDEFEAALTALQKMPAKHMAVRASLEEEYRNRIIEAARPDYATRKKRKRAPLGFRTAREFIGEARKRN